jgi:Bacterial dnaA protein helix-turn-helix
MPQVEMPDYIDCFVSHPLGTGGLVRRLLAVLAGIKDEDDNRYIRMALEFQQTIAARPWMNHCIVARQIGARAFGIATDELLSKDGRKPELVEKRHKIIAFTRVVTGHGYNQIARAFERDRSSIAYSCEKYEDVIRAAIGGGVIGEQ